MDERWMPVPSLAGYEASNLGRLRYAGRLLRGSIDRYGYRYHNVVGRQKRRAHRLVCEAFHGPCPEGLECKHADGDPLNNRAENLSWGTKSENMQDRTRHGRFVSPVRKGELHHSSKLTADLVRQFRQRHEQGESGRSLAKEAGITSANMSKILRGEVWAHTK